MKLRVDRTIQLIRHFTRAKILVIGDVMLDSYLDCRALGIADEAPVPLLEIADQSDALGGAANVARNLTRLGAQTRLVGLAGNDPAGTALTSLLKKSSVDFLPLITHRPTTRKTRVKAGSHYYLRLDEEETTPLTESENESLAALIQNQMSDVDLVVVSDYEKGLFSSGMAEMIEREAERFHLRVLADLKPLNALHWKRLDLITPNLAEARLLQSLVRPNHQAGRESAEVAQSLSGILGCDLVLKMDSQGMLVATTSGRISRLDAICRSPRDTSGAGDTVLSTLAAAMAQGAELEEAAGLANLAASIAVSQDGTYAVSAEELIQALVNSPGLPRTTKVL